MTSADQPPANGQIYTARSIILKPQSSLPTTDLVTGELAYKSSDKTLYHYDGTAWAAVGGSSSSGVTAMSAESADTYFLAGAAQYCYNLSAAAAVSMTGDTTTVYTDWRLPTLGELLVFLGSSTSANLVWTSTVYETGNDSYIEARLTTGGFYAATAYNCLIVNAGGTAICGKARCVR